MGGDLTLSLILPNQSSWRRFLSTVRRLRRIELGEWEQGADSQHHRAEEAWMPRGELRAAHRQRGQGL
jgi:hypothetical protein